MRIAITGTRGIPNRYGGFENFAEKLSIRLAKKGIEMLVYNPHYHSFDGTSFQGVRICRIHSLEKMMGAGGTYLYDLVCLIDAIKRRSDIILECGYASAAPWYPLLRRGKTRLVTHMDGMEWQREKWGKWTKNMILRAERTAVKYSDSIICDNPVVAAYYKKKYWGAPEMISYGAEIREDWDDGVLYEIGLKLEEYYLMIARMEPENNIRMIIEGFLASRACETLVVVGSYSGKHGRRIFREFNENKRIRFMGGIFDQKILDHLRHYSKAVLHGHSVGGTNPSLLEAMAANAFIIAHDNPYNKWVLADNACFFGNTSELSSLLERIEKLKQSGNEYIKNNLTRIRTEFQWELIINQYEALFARLMENSG